MNFELDAHFILFDSNEKYDVGILLNDCSERLNLSDKEFNEIVDIVIKDFNKKTILKIYFDKKII